MGNILLGGQSPVAETYKLEGPVVIIFAISLSLIAMRRTEEAERWAVMEQYGWRVVWSISDGDIV